MNVRFYPDGAPSQHVALDGRLIGQVEATGNGQWLARAFTGASQVLLTLDGVGLWLAQQDRRQRPFMRLAQ